MVNERVARMRTKSWRQIASAPAPSRDAVIAVDLLGLSYGEAPRSLRTREATITTRPYRGRQHVASALISDTEARFLTTALDNAAHSHCCSAGVGLEIELVSRTP